MRSRAGDDGLTKDAYLYFKWSGTLDTGWQREKTKEEILAFWDEYRQVIMDRYLDDLRAKKDYSGRRPSFYFYELEEKDPRRKTGVEEWVGPVRGDGGDRTLVDDVFETDYEYLKRLNLLESWELEIT